MAGEVLIGEARKRASKPGELIEPGETLSVDAPPAFVSRGGVKLANALSATGLEVNGRMAIDVGASTGGFTDCLLERGVDRVIAVDVGYGELHWRLRNDARVVVLERTNARSLTAGALPYRPNLAVVDVSFISLAKVLPAILACMAVEYDMLALVKPQFEVGKGNVGKGGVVREPGLRREALIAAGESARSLGAAVLGYSSSGLPGPKGNRETFIWLAEEGRPGGAGDRERLAELAGAVEPEVEFSKGEVAR
jgi:23S rRNA (cytidine1920-2'-O)/16S rRNA (cytidine1409-2'-O)-methyltransferase